MDGLPYHPLTQELLDRIVQHPKGSYLLHGPSGLGKRAAAGELARRLNCLGDEPGECRSCQALRHGNFADLWTTDSSEEQLKIEQVRSMISALALKPYYANSRRVFVLDARNGMTAEAQNALLKAFEEPPRRTVILLIATRLEQLLLTVRSRCEPIFFATPEPAQTAAWMTGLGQTATLATQLVALAGGRPELARRLSQDDSLREDYAQAQTGADQLLTPDLFDRLMAAKGLAEQKGLVELVAQALRQRFRTVAHQPAAVSPGMERGLTALESFQRRLRGGVTPKAALECLALELPR